MAPDCLWRSYEYGLLCVSIRLGYPNWLEMGLLYPNGDRVWTLGALYGVGFSISIYTFIANDLSFKAGLTKYAPQTTRSVRLLSEA